MCEFQRNARAIVEDTEAVVMPGLAGACAFGLLRLGTKRMRMNLLVTQGARRAHPLAFMHELALTSLLHSPAKILLLENSVSRPFTVFCCI